MAVPFILFIVLSTGKYLKPTPMALSQNARVEHCVYPDSKQRRRLTVRPKLSGCIKNVFYGLFGLRFPASIASMQFFELFKHRTLKSKSVRPFLLNKHNGEPQWKRPRAFR